MRRTMAMALMLAGTAMADDYLYVLDDGTVNGAGGANDPTFLLGNYFASVPGHERIVGIEWGNGALPRPNVVTALLYEDPTDDGDPSDAVLMAQVPLETGDDFKFVHGTFPGTTVSEGFFVAVLVELEVDTFPHLDFDTSNPGSSWTAFGDVDIEDLGASGISQPPVPVTWLLRAIAGPACVADFDSSGRQDVLDFVAFQQAFAGAHACADVNGDNALDVLDFVAFQQAFARGCD